MLEICRDWTQSIGRRVGIIDKDSHRIDKDRRKHGVDGDRNMLGTLKLRELLSTVHPVAFIGSGIRTGERYGHSTI